MSAVSKDFTGVVDTYDDLSHEEIKTPYVDGKKEGIQEIYGVQSGITTKTEFHNNKENGIREISYGHGEQEIVTFVDGKKQGMEISSIDAELLKLTSYVDDKKHGVEIEWDYDGFNTELLSIKNFSEDKQDGKTYIFENDVVALVEEYAKGELISSKNDRVTLAKARLIEIPEIMKQAQVNKYKEDLMEKEKLSEDIRQAYRDAEKLSSLSGTVLNDKAVKAGIKINVPRDNKTLAFSVAAEKIRS